MDLNYIFSYTQTLVEQNVYLHSLIILAFFLIVAKLLTHTSKNLLKKLAAKTVTELDDLIIQKADKSLALIIILIGIKTALFPLELGGFILLIATRTINSFLVLAAMFLAISVMDILLDSWGRAWAKRTKSHMDRYLLNVLHRIFRVLLAVLAIIFVLSTWGVKISPLLASLGIAGIAIAFALQNTLGNIFGGMSLIIDRSIKVGDVIELEDKTVGKVVDVGLRSTKLRTFDNEFVVVPNGNLANKQIKNYVPPDPSARLTLPFNVSYGSDVEKVKKVVLESLKGITGIAKEPKPFVRFLEMGDSALKFKTYIWVENYLNRFKVKDAANTRIYNALNKAKIIIPFPQMDVHVKK